MNICKTLVLTIGMCSWMFCSSAQTAMIKWTDMSKILNPENDTTYIINFWATWCKPCVQELPNFEKIGSVYQSKKTKVILISLDFKREFESRLKPFVKDRAIKSTVYLLDEPNYNSWIDKVDTGWSGAIPATIIINKQKNIHQFYEREFTFEELNKIVEPLIN